MRLREQARSVCIKFDRCCTFVTSFKNFFPFSPELDIKSYRLTFQVNSIHELYSFPFKFWFTSGYLSTKEAKNCFDMSAGKSLLDENDDENKLLSEIEEENTTSADKGDPWNAIHDMQKSITAMAESIHEIYKQNAESKAPSTAQQSVPSQKRKTTAEAVKQHQKRRKLIAIGQFRYFKIQL